MALRGTSVGNMLKKQNPVTDLLCFNSENFWRVHHLLRLITESTCPRQKNISYVATASLPNKNTSEWIGMQAYRGKVQLEIRLPSSNKEFTTSRRNKHLVIQRCTILLVHCRLTMMGITQKKQQKYIDSRPVSLNIQPTKKHSNPACFLCCVLPQLLTRTWSS